VKYLNITKDDMLNGEGLRVVLWVSGCERHCQGCHNAFAWDADCGLEFDDVAREEIFSQLDKDYIAGLTLSGGDPLSDKNRGAVADLISVVRARYPEKTIWLYSGYKWEEVCNEPLMGEIDVLVDGEYIEGERDVKLHWCGSSNQRVIDVQKSLIRALGEEPILWQG
jgi:anaerobic ribonucleoside-triphosphate reductase activating protein